MEKEVEKVVCSMLIRVLEHLGFESGKAGKVVSQCIRLAKKYDDIEEYEREAHKILEREGVVEKIPSKLQERAKRIVSQIAPHVLEGKVCDYGCGDGRVGKLLAESGREVELCDVYENGNVGEMGLGFGKVEQSGQAPHTDGEFGTTLALTVWHHCDNPEQVVEENTRITKEGGRVIAIESVYGVHEDFGLGQEGLGEYLSLTDEQQRNVNIFFDHFYNRVLHYSRDSGCKVNVPFNFNTPRRWKEMLEEKGFEVEVVHLGIDQPAVPEYHVLIMATKKHGTGESNVEKHDVGKMSLEKLDWEERFTYLKNVPFAREELGGGEVKFQIVKFKSGAVLEPHHHKETHEIFFVQNGEGIIEINGERMECKPGDFVLCKPGDVHGFENMGRGEFVVLVFKPKEGGSEDIYWD